MAEKPGVLAAITKLLADESISLATVSQNQPVEGRKEVAVVLTTHPTSTGAMERALKKMHRLKVEEPGKGVTNLRGITSGCVRWGICMAHAESTIRIAAKAEDVMAVISDFEKYPEFLPEIRAVSGFKT